MEIIHETDDSPRGTFRAQDDDGPLGSMVYVRSAPDKIIVQHTGTELRARGRGVAKALFWHMVEWARETGTRVTAQCAFTRKMFREHPESRDVQR